MLISEFLRISPDSFRKLSRFDQLVKMQHYGLPTRLLDTTLNPLVALFFACFEKTQIDKDGCVYLFPQLPTVRGDNAFVSLVIKYVFESNGLSLDIKNFLDDVMKDKKIQSPHTAKIEKISNLIHILTKVPFHAIIPNLNNERIYNQDGSFLLFGMNVKNIKVSKNAGNYGKEYYVFEKIKFSNDPCTLWENSQKIIIPSSYKESILRELRLFGISKEKMFPELDNQAEVITERIKYETNFYYKPINQ